MDILVFRDVESSFFCGNLTPGFKKLGLQLRLCKEANILWSHHEERRELPGERDNARNNARCTQARKTMHSLDGQHQ